MLGAVEVEVEGSMVRNGDGMEWSDGKYVVVS